MEHPNVVVLFEKAEGTDDLLEPFVLREYQVMKFITDKIWIDTFALIVILHVNVFKVLALSL